MVIIGTVLLQSVTAGPIAKWLDVAEPEPKGFLIIGADCLALAIATALKKNGFTALLADQTWENINQANMLGLKTYWGNAVSEHADRRLNLTGIGRMLALSANDDFNALAAKHYRMEFGDNNIYSVRNEKAARKPSKEKASIKHGGQPLFQETATREYLCTLAAAGAEIKTTLLTDQFPYEKYLRQENVRRVPLFAIDPKNRIHPLTPNRKISPQANWKIIGITAR